MENILEYEDSGNQIPPRWRDNSTTLRQFKLNFSRLFQNIII